MIAKPYVMLGWLLMTQLAVGFVGRSVAPLTPFIQGSFSLSKAELGLMPAAFFTGQLLSCLPAGWFADRIGTKKMLLLLSLILSGFFLMVSVTTSYWVVLLGLLLGGIGYGAMHPSSSRGIIHWFSSKKAGMAMGIKQMGVTAGSAIAALLLIPVAEIYGWRTAIVWASVSLMMIGFTAFLFYRNSPSEQLSQKNEREPVRITLQKLFRNKPLMIVSIAAIGLNGAQLCFTTYLILFLTDHLHFAMVAAGTFLAISEIGGCLGRICWGIISDRLFQGNRLIILILISVITAVLCVGLAFLPGNTSFWMMLTLVSLIGFCLAGFNGIWMNFASESVDHKDSGIANGFSVSIGSLGVVLIPPCFGKLLDMATSYFYAWLFVSIIMMVVAVMLLSIKSRVAKRSCIVQEELVY